MDDLLAYLEEEAAKEKRAASSLFDQVTYQVNATQIEAKEIFDARQKELEKQAGVGKFIGKVVGGPHRAAAQKKLMTQLHKAEIGKLDNTKSLYGARDAVAKAEKEIAEARTKAAIGGGVAIAAGGALKKEKDSAKGRDEFGDKRKEANVGAAIASWVSKLRKGKAAARAASASKRATKKSRAHLGELASKIKGSEGYKREGYKRGRAFAKKHKGKLILGGTAATGFAAGRATADDD